jgi:hypothetical protein
MPDVQIFSTIAIIYFLGIINHLTLNLEISFQADFAAASL